MWQRFLIEHFCRETYTEFIISAVLSGQLNIKDFWKDKRRYLKHEWIAPGWSWIDPVKEVNANKIALQTGQDTLSRICAERGLDWKEVMQQMAREAKLANDLGINITGGGNSVNSQQASNGNAAGQDS
jgi:capsid protein